MSVPISFDKGISQTHFTTKSLRSQSHCSLHLSFSESPGRMGRVLWPAAFTLLLTLLSCTGESSDSFAENPISRHNPEIKALCEAVIDRYHHPCSEHKVETKDGYILGLHRVSSRSRNIRGPKGPPVLLIHGLFMAGDAWFLDSANQSLGYILADHGFDVWVGNVRGTRWSYGHKFLSHKDKEFWDWSWEDLALYDVKAMLSHVYGTSKSKVFVVGHSQGTIISLAAFTEPDIVKMVEGAALLCPITYLKHVSAPLVRRMVAMHLDEMVVALGIHQLNFWSDIGAQLLDTICDGHADCNDMLSSITGPNCCMNMSRIDFYLEYEPHPSSSKNLRHLFQMIRKGTFARYDYGKLKNLNVYGHFAPPKFDLSLIPKSLPLWVGYGGNDGLADVTDLKHTLKELKSEPELLFLENYGHVDFLLSQTANRDVYDSMLGFFSSFTGKSSSQ